MDEPVSAARRKANDPTRALVDCGAWLAEARAVEALAMADTRKAIVDYVAAGGTEASAARLAGLDRMTVRKILGKR
jgi:hypothetical protein